jgi:hypothetical protein
MPLVGAVRFSTEWCEAAYELTDENAEAPYVRFVVVFLAKHHFRRAVTRSTTIGLETVFLDV